MVSIKYRTVNFSEVILPFLVILTSIVTVESICHATLHTELHLLDSKHFVIELTAALLVTLFIMLLFFRNRQLAQKMNAMALLKSEDEWEKTFNTMTDFISVHDKDFKVIKANQALCDFLGKSSEEIIGKLCYRLFHNMDEPYQDCPHRKAFETDHPVTEIINDPNIGLPLQITCLPLFDDDSAFQGSVHIARVHEIAGKKEEKAGDVIPICAACKNIRNSNNEWKAPEDYFVKKHGCRFTHTVCMDCQEKLYPEYIK